MGLLGGFNAEKNTSFSAKGTKQGVVIVVSNIYLEPHPTSWFLAISPFS